VVKEPLGTKGARITSHLSLPGRFLVYMPTVDHLGVSRKIDSRDERRRLRGIVQRFREQSGLPGGVIIPAAAPIDPRKTSSRT
jgi:ribonuclease G